MEIVIEFINALLWYYYLTSMTSVFTQESFPTNVCQYIHQLVSVSLEKHT